MDSLVRYLNSCSREIPIFDCNIRSINNIPRWAKWIVFIIELNFWLPCFWLSALYLPTHLPRPAGPASLHRRTQSCPYMVILVQFSTKTCCPPPSLFLSKNIIYLWPSTTNIITKSKLNTMQFCPVFWHKSCETIPLRTRVGLLSSPIYQMEVKMKEMRERPDTPQATPISTYTHTIPFKEQVSQKLHALNRKK